MNIPLHLYLAELVGDVNELIITADNARLPCPDHPSYSSGSSNGSSTQVFNASFASLNNSDASISSSSTGGSTSRWDSEINSNRSPHSGGGKERLSMPKKPLRRRDSPPSSPTTERRLRRLENEMRESEGDVLKASSKDGFPAMAPIRLSAAAQDFIRKPVRRNSLTNTNNTGVASAAAAPAAASSSSPPMNSHHHGLNLKKKSAKPTPLGSPPSRNVSDILGEAIRELGFEDDDDGMGAMLCAKAPEFEKVSC